MDASPGPGPEYELFPGDQSASSVAFDSHDRVLEDWTTQTGSVSSLVFARQTAIGGAIRTHTLLRTAGYTTINPTALDVDGAWNPILALSLTPATNVTASQPARATEDSAVAFTVTAGGQLGAAQILGRGCDTESLAVAPSGQAAVAMVCGTSETRSQTWISERPPGELFQPAVRVPAAGTEQISPSVSIAADGRVWVTWDRVVGTEKHFDANIVRNQQLAVDSKGRGIAIWDARVGGRNLPESRVFTLP